MDLPAEKRAVLLDLARGWFGRPGSHDRLAREAVAEMGFDPDDAGVLAVVRRVSIGTFSPSEAVARLAQLPDA